MYTKCPYTQRVIREVLCKSPDGCLKEILFIFNQHLHHLPLVADVIQSCHGVLVGCSHEGGPEDDAQVLRIHQIKFLILCHPAIKSETCMEHGNRRVSVTPPRGWSFKLETAEVMNKKRRHLPF